jgi:hypothetical protein
LPISLNPSIEKDSFPISIIVSEDGTGDKQKTKNSEGFQLSNSISTEILLPPKV